MMFGKPLILPPVTVIPARGPDHGHLVGRYYSRDTGLAMLPGWAAPGADTCVALYEKAVDSAMALKHLNALFRMCEQAYKDKIELKELRQGIMLLCQLMEFGPMLTRFALGHSQLEPPAEFPLLEISLSSLNTGPSSALTDPLDFLIAKVCGYQHATSMVLGTLGMRLLLQKKDHQVEFSWDPYHIAAGLRRGGVTLFSHTYAYNPPSLTKLPVPVRRHTRKSGNLPF